MICENKPDINIKNNPHFGITSYSLRSEEEGYLVVFLNLQLKSSLTTIKMRESLSQFSTCSG